MKKMFLLISTLLLAGASMGANTIWNGSVDSNWMNPANWTGGLPPAANGLSIRYVTTAGATQDVMLAAATTNATLLIGQDGGRSANGNSLTLNSGATNDIRKTQPVC